jgi:prepilin signal peptidase PulO-like enzyme (type II secretory pathway)
MEVIKVKDEKTGFPVKKYMAILSITVYLLLSSIITANTGTIPDTLTPIISMIVGYYFGAGINKGDG